MLSVTRTVKETPAISKELFLSIKNEILGKRYELNIVFIGSTRATSLNKKYRNKTYTPNILSFPVDETLGEIFLCVPVLKQAAKKEKMSYKNYALFLFIHGCLHLKGITHGEKMEQLEDTYFKKYA